MEPKQPSKNPGGKQTDVEAARARALAYKQQSDGEESETSAAPAPRRPRTESEWNDVVSQAIEESMRKGEFDNLRGHGKPLPRNENPFTPPGSELAFEILKNNDLTPGWIGVRNDVQHEIDAWRARLRADATRVAAEWAAAGAANSAQQAVQARWGVERQRLRASLDALNRRIRDVNLQQPISTMHLFMLRLAEEERRAGVPAALL